jgi:hypothetical protein
MEPPQLQRHSQCASVLDLCKQVLARHSSWMPIQGHAPEIGTHPSARLLIRPHEGCVSCVQRATFVWIICLRWVDPEDGAVCSTKKFGGQTPQPSSGWVPCTPGFRLQIQALICMNGVVVCSLYSVGSSEI